MQVKESKIVWESTSWRLRVDTLVTAQGTEIDKGIIEHPGAVVLIPVRETAVSPEVLMISQYRHALNAPLLELPAGTRGWDEEWLACAQRELREETGFRADKIVLMGEFWPSPGVSNEWMHLYLATGLHPDPLPGDIDEEIEVKPIPFAQLLDMAKSGQIVDAKSIIGILKAADYLNRPA
ncbi:MAG: ADP-ribose pyrophosphatase [Chloroflexi bacterium]|nr:MAG: ADP-ribose pyrophosphatase [Chloroflexota bacterium]